MEMIIGMIKIMKLNNANACTLCEYRIILNVLIVCLFTFPKTLFRNAIRAPNSLDPDHFGGPDLGSKCLQSRRYHNRAKCYNFN